MIECHTVQKPAIGFHYSLSTIFYRLLWGPHIHHGLWPVSEPAGGPTFSPKVAQVQLTETLADMAGVKPGATLADIGCGMGGSSIHLARTRSCEVTGVTISRFQQRWARVAAAGQGVSERTQFLHADAETVELPAAHFDVVWSIECTEHLFDKAAFFRRAADWIKPGGRLAICAWLTGEQATTEQHVQAVRDVCEGFFCPSLGTANDYISWMRQAGLEITAWHDWTQRVSETWRICERRVRRSQVRRLARLIDRDTAMFLDRFGTILRAYESGAMQYGAFVAVKPDSG